MANQADPAHLLRPGDTVSLGIAPSIQIVQYALSVRPSATLSRVLTGSPSVDVQLAEMREALRSSAFYALSVELGLVDEVLEVIGGEQGEAGAKALARYCEEVLRGANNPKASVPGAAVRKGGATRRR